MTKDMLKAKRSKTQGRPSTKGGLQKRGTIVKIESTDDQRAQVFSIGLDEANIDQARKQEQRNRILGKGEKRNTIKALPDAHKKEESTHEVVSDAAALRAETREYLNTMKAGKITALPKSLLKNIAQEKKQ